MERIKILWISMYAPVSYAASAGSKTFYYYFDHFRRDENFEIRLVSCGKNAERDRVEAELEDIPHNIIYWGDPRKPLLQRFINLESRFNPWNANANLISNSDVKEILKTIDHDRKKGYIPDFVILEWTPMVLLARKIREMFPKAKIVASEHDVTYIGVERKSNYYKGIKSALYRQKYRWEKKVELEALKSCDLVLVHNPDNCNDLQKAGIVAEKTMWLVPYFHKMFDISRRSNKRDILFFGAMSRPENYLSAIWFIKKVKPLLSDLDTRFVVLGGNPPDELKKLESEDVYVTGFVDSIEFYFESALCMVAPLVLGAGIKVKVIEALSSGTPVLTNHIGIEGIHVQDGEEYLHCEEPAEYAAAIRCLIDKDINEEQMSIKAKQFVKNHFSLEKCFLEYKSKLMEMSKEYDYH